MDENLERLARDAAADPTDEAAARRLDAALARAGREEELRERFRFKFQCPLQWQDLQSQNLTPSEGARTKFCQECKEKVHAVQDVEELRDHVRKGHCVAVPASILAAAFSELSGAPTLHSAMDSKAPCVVAGGAIPKAVPLNLQRILEREDAERLRAAPIGVRANNVVVATAQQKAFQLAALRSRFLLETVLVTETELSALIESIPQQPERERPMLLGRVAPRE